MKRAKRRGRYRLHGWITNPRCLPFVLSRLWTNRKPR